MLGEIGTEIPRKHLRRSRAWFHRLGEGALRDLAHLGRRHFAAAAPLPQHDVSQLSALQQVGHRRLRADPDRGDVLKVTQRFAIGMSIV